jgi:hypothetical protein
MKAEFEQTDSESFQFKVPNGITGSNTHNKLVIVTQQTDEISAFYIHVHSIFMKVWKFHERTDGCSMRIWSTPIAF